jgi:outer membrane protein assembly factor BamA
VYFDVSLSANLFYPSLYLYAGRSVYEDWDVVVNDQTFPVTTEEYTLFFEVAFPFSRVRDYHALFFNYDVHFYDRWTELPLDPQEPTPWLPDDRTRAWLSFGWYTSSVRRYIDSISAEEGLAASISLRYAHPSIGSGISVAEGRFALRSYWPVLQRWHHVLAFGLQGGAAIGEARHRPVYVIGGLPLRDPIQDAYFGYRYSDVYLRGYEPAAFAGWCFLLGSLEYRLPLLNIERGVLSLPFYLSRLHASVFADAGSVALRLRQLDDQVKVSLGGELRLDMLLAYYLPFSVRLGYAHGLTADGVNNVYLTLGSGF